MESDEEEPAPEALKRYMAMRRHTIGVGDSEHDTPQDTRTKLAHHKPMIGTCLGLYDYMYHNTQIQVKGLVSVLPIRVCTLQLSIVT